MRTVLVLCCFLLVQAALGDQYRSKLYLDKGAQLGESINLSLEALEKQFDSLADDYSKSSAGRHLARSYVNSGEYDKAIKYYEDALKAEGLSEHANQEMLKELAMVYVLQKKYRQAVAVFTRLRNSSTSTDPQLLLLMAQAQVAMGDYVGMTNTLESLMPQLDRFNESELKLLAGLYYKGGNYKRSATVLKRLLRVNSKEPVYWQQLTAIYLAQNKNKQALDQLELARQKKIPFRSQDVVLLTDLYAANGAAEKAARLLQQALEKGAVDNTAANNKRLYEFWLQAREKKQAAAALKKTVSLSYSTELWLQLAQLHLEQEQWAAMKQAVLGACSRVLSDKYVSRANLLLGVSLQKLGDTEGARRAFINATLVAGETSRAQQWLAFVKAAPPTERELRMITKPCVPKATRVQYVKGMAPADAGSSADAAEEVSGDEEDLLPTKTIASLGFYTTKLKLDNGNPGSSIRGGAAALGVSLVKGGGSIDGPLTMLIDFEEASVSDLRLGLPYRGQPSAKGRFKLVKGNDFLCVYRLYEGPGEEMLASLTQFAEEARLGGFSLSGQARLVINSGRGASAGQVSTEFQLGIL